MERKSLDNESDGGMLTNASYKALNAKVNKMLVALAALSVLSVILLGVSIAAISTAASAKNDAKGGSSSSSLSGSRDTMISTNSQAPDGYRFVAPLFQAAGYWTEAPPLPVPSLTDHSVLAAGTSAYLVGGAVHTYDTNSTSPDGTETIVDTLYEFDSLLGIFTARNPMPSGPRYRHAAAYLNGKIYVTGGFNASDSADLQTILPGTLIYDVATDTWTELASATPNTPRSDACMAAVQGKIYLAGGWSQNYEDTLKTVEVFDLATSTWITIEDMPTPRGDAACVMLGGATATTDGDGDDNDNAEERFVVAGGFYDPSGEFKPGSFLKTVEAYSPSSKTWTTLAPMLHARGDKAIARLPNNQLIVLGGETTIDNRNQVASNQAAIYIPQEDTWVSTTPMPFGRFRFGAAYVDGLGLYAFGGSTTSVCDAEGICKIRGGEETVFKLLTTEEKSDIYLFVEE